MIKKRLRRAEKIAKRLKGKSLTGAERVDGKTFLDTGLDQDISSESEIDHREKILPYQTETRFNGPKVQQ